MQGKWLDGNMGAESKQTKHMNDEVEQWFLLPGRTTASARPTGETGSSAGRELRWMAGESAADLHLMDEN